MGREMDRVEFLELLDPLAGVTIAREGPNSAAEFFAYCGQFPDAESKMALVHGGVEGEINRFMIDQISQARVFIDLAADTIEKEVISLSEYGILQRELAWLDRLQGVDWIPKLLRSSGNVLTLSYEGEPLRQHNLPADWSRQAEAILTALEEFDCSHNDIKCDNIVVRSGRMSLIDFGWATRIGQPIPGDWPKQLGRQHRLGVHVFDDRHAIFAACHEAARGKVNSSKRVID